MDVSFAISSDELFTLLHIYPLKTDAGNLFAKEALCNARISDLSTLIAKNLAQRINNEIALEPVMHLIVNAISNAVSALQCGGIWRIESPWVNLTCEKYTFMEDHWRITPINNTCVER